MRLVELFERVTVVVVPTRDPPAEAIPPPAFLSIDEYRIVTDVKAPSELLGWPSSSVVLVSRSKNSFLAFGRSRLSVTARPSQALQTRFA
jgi:hypothetical protein